MLPSGMPSDVLNVVKSAVQAGVKVELVNVMATLGALLGDRSNAGRVLKDLRSVLEKRRS
ncbi:MAG TPA: hypothetical protein VGG89_01670 [Candidatus Baltobacteraceae bacterium]